MFELVNFNGLLQIYMDCNEQAPYKQNIFAVLMLCSLKYAASENCMTKMIGALLLIGAPRNYQQKHVGP